MSAKGSFLQVCGMNDQPLAKKRGGKRRPSIFTQRAVARAGRACPDRIIRICTDGTIELVPIGEGAPAKDQNEWDDVK
jgi:hypothetical protein